MTADPSPAHPPVRAAAVIYPHGRRNRDLLVAFAAELKDRGVRVGGLVQEALADGEGCKSGIDAIELDTGRRIPINRPTRAQLMYHECSLDAAALVEATGAVRRAVEERMDLIVVEKFGEQESNGQGLADDILLAIAEDIPTLVAVPVDFTDSWAHFSGGLATTLPYDAAALRDWWAAVHADSGAASEVS